MTDRYLKELESQNIELRSRLIEADEKIGRLEEEIGNWESRWKKMQTERGEDEWHVKERKSLIGQQVLNGQLSKKFLMDEIERK